MPIGSPLKRMLVRARQSCPHLKILRHLHSLSLVHFRYVPRSGSDCTCRLLHELKRIAAPVMDISTSNPINGWWADGQNSDVLGQLLKFLVAKPNGSAKDWHRERCMSQPLTHEWQSSPNGRPSLPLTSEFQF